MERACVSVEQHLVALRRVGREPEGPAAGELGVRDLQPSAQATDEDVLVGVDVGYAYGVSKSVSVSVSVSVSMSVSVSVSMSVSVSVRAR